MLKKSLILLILLVIVFIFVLVSMPKSKVFIFTYSDIEYNIITPSPGYTVERLSGTSIIKYYTLLPIDRVEKFYNEKKEDLKAKGYRAYLVNDKYEMFFEFSKNDIYYIPHIELGELKNSIVKRLFIDYPFIDNIEKEELVDELFGNIEESVLD